MTTKASAVVDFRMAATSGTSRGSSWRRAPIAIAALVPAGVRTVSRAAARSLVFTETDVVQCPGKQRWICSTDWRKTTLSLGAVLFMLDNRVERDNAAVKKTTRPAAVRFACVLRPRHVALCESRSGNHPVVRGLQPGAAALRLQPRNWPRAYRVWADERL